MNRNPHDLLATVTAIALLMLGWMGHTDADADAGSEADVNARHARVAVTPFGGPGHLARQAHAAVVGIITVEHQPISSAQILVAGAEVGGDVRKPEVALIVARLTGADIVVAGRVRASGQGYKLAITVRQAQTGRSVGAILVPLFSAQITSADKDRIRPLLLSLLRQSESSVRTAGARASLMVSAAPPAPLSSSEPITIASARSGSGSSASSSPVSVSLSAGLSMTSRTLRFVTKPGLRTGTDLATSPSVGSRFDVSVMTASSPRIGIALDVDRSFSAKLSGPQTGLAIAVTQQQSAAAVVGEVDIRRVTLGVRLGYNRIQYVVHQRPLGLTLPDVRYASVEFGLNAKVALSDGKLSLFGAAGFHQVINAAGITDSRWYGDASVRALEGEGGVLVRMTESLSARAGVRGVRVVLNFFGNGKVAQNLDADPDQDVSAATDRYLSGYAQLVFKL